MSMSEFLFSLQGIGDMTLAYQCFRLTLSNNNDHAEAYNNLGVLELRKGHVDMVRNSCSKKCLKRPLKNRQNKDLKD